MVDCIWFGFIKQPLLVVPTVTEYD